MRYRRAAVRPLALCGLVGVLLGGCSRSGPARRAAPLSAAAQAGALQGHLEVWGWNIAAKSLQKLVPDFRRRCPGVSVNVDMTGANMQTRFLLSLAAGVGAPDVSQLQLVDAPRYIATGRLADLTPVAKRYEGMFPDALWKNCTRNGRIYAIPWDMGPCAVFYKRDLFARYGVDPARIETWDDFIAAGKEILRKSGGKTKMLPLDAGFLSSFFEILLQQNSGQVFDAEGRIAINSPQGRQALEQIKRLLQSGICSNVQMWSHEFLAGLKSDTIATYPTAVWFGGTIKDTVQEYAGQESSWGVFPLPALAKGGLRTSNLGGSVLVIPDQCPRKEAAWAFIEYALCTREGQIAQYRNFDLFPALLPALKDPFFAAGDPFYGGQKIRRLFARDVTRIPTLNRTKDWVEAMTYVGQALSKWAVTGMETRGFLETLEQKLHRRIGRPVAPATAASLPGGRAAPREWGFGTDVQAARGCPPAGLTRRCWGARRFIVGRIDARRALRAVRGGPVVAGPSGAGGRIQEGC